VVWGRLFAIWGAPQCSDAVCLDFFKKSPNTYRRKEERCSDKEGEIGYGVSLRPTGSRKFPVKGKRKGRGKGGARKVGTAIPEIHDPGDPSEIKILSDV